MRKEELIQRGREAADLMDNEVLKAAFEEARERCVSVFKSSSSTDEDVLEARRKMSSVDLVWGVLDGWRFDYTSKMKGQHRE